MSLNDWIGRRVRVTAWEIMTLVAYYLRRTRGHGDSLEGTVVHVGARSDSDDESEVWVQLDGLEGEYVFGPSQLEVLPVDGALRPWEPRDATRGGVAVCTVPAQWAFMQGWPVERLASGIRLGHPLAAFRDGFRLWGMEEILPLSAAGEWPETPPPEWKLI